MMTTLAGREFTHAQIVAEGWRPTESQKYSDAPRARMVITRATDRRIYFTYAGGTKGHWWLSRDAFMAQYGEQVAA